MSKIYLDVQVPGTARTYEFSCDSRMKVGTVKENFIKQISALEGRNLFSNPNKILTCSQSLEGMLQDNEILGEIGIKSGDTIILI